MSYAFEDDYGGKSETITYLFDILPRGAFEIIEGELISMTDTNQFEITVDYSVANEYCLSLLRTGTGGTVVTAYYSDGSTKVGYADTEGPAYGERISSYVTLPRPDGVTGEYTYILTVETDKKRYVEGDTTYRIAYGDSSQKYYFFEGVANCIDLPYYRTTANYNSVVPVYSAWAATSSVGHYYKITAVGPEVVTLISSYGQYSFKILDCDSLQTLYDGANLPRINYEMYTTTYTSSVRLNFEAGKSYYIVVYDSKGTDHRGCYSILAGERYVVLGKETFELNPASTSYTWTKRLVTPTEGTAYVDRVHYQPKAAASPAMSMRIPGLQSWTPLTLHDFNSGYQNGAAPIRADGQWQFKVSATSADPYRGGTVDVYYWFEV